MSEVFSSAGQPGALSCSEGLQVPVLEAVRGRCSAADPHMRLFIFTDPSGREALARPEAVLSLAWFSLLSLDDQQFVQRRLAWWAGVDRDAAEASRSAQ